MFLFDEVLLAHALDGVVLLVLFVLTEHHLPEGSSAEHLQQLELLEVGDVVLIRFALKNNLALPLRLVVLLHAFGIQHQRLDRVQLLVVLAHVVYRRRVGLQREVVVVVKRHLRLVLSALSGKVLAIAFDDSLHNLQLEVGG